MRAIDPLTRGALRERMLIIGSAVRLRSFLDPPTPAGHTIKGSGEVAYRDNRKNSKTTPMFNAMQRAMNNHMTTCGVDPAHYDYGVVTVMDTTAIVSLNGRRYITHIRTNDVRSINICLVFLFCVNICCNQKQTLALHTNTYIC